MTLRVSAVQRRYLPYAGLAIVVLAAHVIVALLVGAHGWDDGAITLAFARTFADTGHIALTPVSVTVEGSSSPFWFALLAATHKILSPGFYGFITASQLWSGVFTTVTALLAYRLLVPRLGRRVAWVSCVAVFVSAPFLNETMNGMEMSALAAVAVLLALLVDGRPDRFRWAVFAVAFVGPVVRLEAIGYLLAAAAGMILFSRYFRTAAAIAAGSISSVLFLTAGRLVVFGAWLPNTIKAKRWAPYSSQSLMAKLHSTLSVAVETVLLFAPELAFAAFLALLCWPLFRWRRDWLAKTVRARRLSPVIAFAASYVAGVVALNLVIGRNWGHQGRMELSAAALALLLMAAGAQHVGNWKVAATGALVVAVLLSSVATLQINNVKQALAHQDHSSSTGNVTPAMLRATGLAVDEIRVALGRPTLEYLTPDVGGSSLCCNRLRIDDAALLANPTLSARGYRDFNDYLKLTSPNIIEIHAVWAKLTDIYQSTFFARNYVPVVVDATVFYLRLDDFEALHDRCAEVSREATELRGRSTERDRFLKSHGYSHLCALQLGK